MLAGESRCFGLTDLDLLVELALTQFSGEKNGTYLSKGWRNRPTALSWYNEIKNMFYTLTPLVLDVYFFLCNEIHVFTHEIAYKHHTNISVTMWFAVSYIKCILHFKAKT